MNSKYYLFYVNKMKDYIETNKNSIINEEQDNKLYKYIKEIWKPTTEMTKEELITTFIYTYKQCYDKIYDYKEFINHYNNWLTEQHIFICKNKNKSVYKYLKNKPV